MQGAYAGRHAQRGGAAYAVADASVILIVFVACSCCDVDGEQQGGYDYFLHVYSQVTLNLSTQSVLPTAPINSAPLVLDEHTMARL